MKRLIFFSLSLVSAILVILGFNSYAQGGEESPFRSHKEYHPYVVAFDQIIPNLKLSPEQSTTIKNLRLKTIEENSKIHQQLEQKRTEFHKQRIEEGKRPQDQKPDRQEIKGLIEQLEQNAKACKDGIRTTLNAEQLKIVDEWIKNLGEKRQERRGGRFHQR